jgi:hypothetical protein
MMAMSYLLVVTIAFGACYAVYGLGITIVRLIRSRHGKPAIVVSQGRYGIDVAPF